MNVRLHPHAVERLSKRGATEEGVAATVQTGGAREAMEYRISDHARLEMARRKIPLTLVEEILRNPEQTIPEKAGRTAYQSRQDIGGKMFLIRVIVNSAVDPAVVVTIYRTTKIQKYWRAP